ncbi:hypothetical protein ACFC8N_17260 [Streptomyces sp. NPDC055966]|uniref:hypothetical protein n=1 Tax=Streptomyces sp. NPDC055966 TaxID=3345669 RepID=UPI0035DE9C28
MYTSDSNGRPKGAEIARSSIRNFLRVVGPVYDMRPGDRVYQDMTISFDFSIEEIWPPGPLAPPSSPARRTRHG